MSYINELREEGSSFYIKNSDKSPEEIAENIDFVLLLFSMKTYRLHFLEGIQTAAEKSGKKEVVEYCSKKLEETKKELHIT